MVLPTERGAYHAARQVAQTLWDYHLRVYGSEHPYTLTIMSNLANTLKAQGDHAGARTLEEQVLAASRRVLGPEHPSTLTSLNNLALIVEDEAERSAVNEGMTF